MELELETFGVTQGQEASSPAESEASTSSATKGKKHCDICQRTFSNSTKFQHHYRFAHEGQTFDCDVAGCSKKYSCIGNLNQHKKKIHNIFVKTEKDSSTTSSIPNMDDVDVDLEPATKKKQMFCSLCDKSFTSKSGLSRHMSTCGDVNVKVECVICGAKLTKQFLPNHLSATHPKIDIESFLRCDLCLDVFKDFAQRCEHSCRVKHPTPVKQKLRSSKPKL